MKKMSKHNGSRENGSSGMIPSALTCLRVFYAFLYISQKPWLEKTKAQPQSQSDQHIVSYCPV